MKPAIKAMLTVTAIILLLCAFIAFYYIHNVMIVYDKGDITEIQPAITAAADTQQLFLKHIKHKLTHNPVGQPLFCNKKAF